MKKACLMMMALAFLTLTAPTAAWGDEAGLWQELQKLFAGDGAAFDDLGWSVALDGDAALVGARGADVNGNFRQGAAYVFTRTGGLWAQQAKLVAGDGAAFDGFGISVALDGDTALVGAANAAVNGVRQGAAYVFTRTGEGWVQQGKLVAGDGAASDAFGLSVTLDGGTALVGAYNAAVNGNRFQGVAYVFTRAGEGWVQRAKLVAGDGAAFDRFGGSVALHGDTALVGAGYAAVNGNSGQGAAYVFSRTSDGWAQQAKLVAGDGAASDGFGISVALDGDTALVGALGADVNGNGPQGAAYVFIRTGGDWVQQAKLVAGDSAVFDDFGTSVALDGDTALVGAWGAAVNGNFQQGAAYVFSRTGEGWAQQAKLVAGDGAADDVFGWSVALDGDTGLMGAPGADVDGNRWQGAAYVFTLPTTERPALACLGADVGLFMPPLDVEVIVRGPNRVLPLRMQLFDAAGLEVTGADLDSAPVLEVVFLGENSGGAGIPDELDYSGQGDAGNRFSYGEDYWQFNLGTGSFSAPGLYGITVEAGDDSHTIDPGCTASFVIR